MLTHQPHDAMKEIEEAVVCGLLLGSNCLPEISQQLTAEMFATPELGFIYGAIVEQYNRGERPDMITTDAEMLRTDSAQYGAMGGTAYLSAGMRRIRHGENVTVYAAEVKRRYILRRLERLFAGLQLKASAPETDATALIPEAESALMDLRELQLTGSLPIRPIADIARETLDFHRAHAGKPADKGFVLTGLDEFDALTGGMHAGELFVGAGRPGDGKSAVALQIAINAASAGKAVCFFSLEMTDRQIMDRLYAGHAEVDAARLRVSKLSPTELKEMEKLSAKWLDLPLYLDYMAVNSVENIRAQVLLQIKRKGCGLIVVDYLHMLEYRPRKNETLEQVIARHIRALKALAKEAGCPVLVLSQMNRASETRHDKSHLPMLSDLRDSGTIEQVADCVFFVYRPDRHGITKDERTGENLAGVSKLIVAKHRNGATGIARIRHNSTFTRLGSYGEIVVGS